MRKVGYRIRNYKDGIDQYAKTGVNDSKRRIYFQKRTEKRIKELMELDRDIDYLIGELQRLERRTNCFDLISHQLDYISIRLAYLFERKNYKSDQALERAFTKRWNLSRSHIHNIIFTWVDSSCWYLIQTEGGKEIDAYIPPEIAQRTPDMVKVKGKKIKNLHRDELMELVTVLCLKMNEYEAYLKSLNMRKKEYGQPEPIGLEI